MLRRGSRNRRLLVLLLTAALALSGLMLGGCGAATTRSRPAAARHGAAPLSTVRTPPLSVTARRRLHGAGRLQPTPAWLPPAARSLLPELRRLLTQLGPALSGSARVRHRGAAGGFFAPGHRPRALPVPHVTLPPDSGSACYAAGGGCSIHPCAIEAGGGAVIVGPGSASGAPGRALRVSPVQAGGGGDRTCLRPAGRPPTTQPISLTAGLLVEG